MNGNEQKILDEASELQREHQRLTMENMPQFDRGIVEASFEHEVALWEELKPIFLKHGIMPEVKMAIKSDTKPSDDPFRPIVVCPGVDVMLRYIVYPIAKDGKSGVFPEHVTVRLSEIEKRLKVLQTEMQKA